MDERQFVQDRQASWRRFTEILQKAEKAGNLKGLSRQEVKELGPLYRRTASDLAYARAHSVSASVVSHLNALLARGYVLLYQSQNRSLRGFGQFFTFDFPDTFRRRYRLFLASAGFMLLGALIGYILIIQSRDNMDIFLPKGSMLHSSIEFWEKGEVANKIEDGQAATQASFLMQNNIRVSFVAFAVGILGGVISCYLMFVNGAILGAMVGLMTRVKQHHNFWPGILPHGIVELSETCIAGAAGLSLGLALLAPGPFSRKEALVLASRDSIKLIVGGMFLLIFAGLVEAFISHSLLPKPLKITFGIVSGVAMYAYLLLMGRDKEPPKASSSP